MRFGRSPNVFDHDCGLLWVDIELRAVQHLAVFHQDSRVHAQGDLVLSQHADDFATISKGSKQPRDQHIRIKHDFHVAGFRRPCLTLIISASISVIGN